MKTGKKVFFVGHPKALGDDNPEYMIMVRELDFYFDVAIEHLSTWHSGAKIPHTIVKEHDQYINARKLLEQCDIVYADVTRHHVQTGMMIVEAINLGKTIYLGCELKRIELITKNIWISQHPGIDMKLLFPWENTHDIGNTIERIGLLERPIAHVVQIEEKVRLALFAEKINCLRQLYQMTPEQWRDLKLKSPYRSEIYSFNEKHGFKSMISWQPPALQEEQKKVA